MHEQFNPKRWFFFLLPVYRGMGIFLFMFPIKHSMLLACLLGKISLALLPSGAKAHKWLLAECWQAWARRMCFPFKSGQLRGCWQYSSDSPGSASVSPFSPWHTLLQVSVSSLEWPVVGSEGAEGASLHRFMSFACRAVLLNCWVWAGWKNVWLLNWALATQPRWSSSHISLHWGFCVHNRILFFEAELTPKTWISQNGHRPSEASEPFPNTCVDSYR